MKKVNTSSLHNFTVMHILSTNFFSTSDYFTHLKLILMVIGWNFCCTISVWLVYFEHTIFWHVRTRILRGNNGSVCKKKGSHLQKLYGFCHTIYHTRTQVQENISHALLIRLLANNKQSWVVFIIIFSPSFIK